MKPVHGFLLALVAVCLLGALCLSGCAGSKVAKRLDELEQADYDALKVRASLVSRVLGARLAREGSSQSAKVVSIADAAEAIATDPAAMVVAGVISSKLKAEGWTEDEALLAVLLLEDTLRHWGGFGEIGTPLSARARDLLLVIANSLREGVAFGTVPDEDSAANEMIVEAAQS